MVWRAVILLTLKKPFAKLPTGRGEQRHVFLFGAGASINCSRNKRRKTYVAFAGFIRLNVSGTRDVAPFLDSDGKLQAKRVTFQMSLEHEDLKTSAASE